MTHLRIIQNNGVTEEVSSSVILKLYELATSGNLDNTSVLLGRVHTTVAKDIHLNYFSPVSGTKPYPEFYVSSTSIAVTFVDPEVERVLVNAWGSDDMITMDLINTHTGIANLMFKNNTTITSFNELGRLTTLTNIGSEAFYGCTNLTSIDLSNIRTFGGYNALRGCTGLTGVIDLPSVETLSSNVFYGCTGITQINIGLNFTGWKDSNTLDVFKGCTNLLTITGLPESFANKYDTGIFSGCRKLQMTVDFTGVTNIGGSCFYECKSMTFTGTIDNALIGASAFYSQTSTNKCDLSNVNITLTTNPSDYCFHYCVLPSTITIGPNATQIGTQTFRYCTGLTTIVGASGVTSIGNEAFRESTLLSFPVFSQLTSIGSHAFRLTLISGALNLSACTTLKDFAFAGVTGITSVSAPLVTELKEGVFQDCTSLASINLPQVVSLTGGSYFKRCTSLTEVILPECTTLSGGGVFSGCTSLSKIILPKLTTLTNGAVEIFKNLAPNCVVDIGPDKSTWPKDVAKDGQSWILILRYQGVVSCPNGIYSGHYTNAIIYVPRDYVQSYRTTTPWSNITNVSNVILPLEDSPYASTTWYLNAS